MADKAAPDSSRRSERSRRAILDAALELLGELGYPRLTVEAIAARAGVGKQTIYRWWPSKAAVLLDAFTDPGATPEGAEASEGAERAGAALPDTGDLEADLKLVLRAAVDQMNAPAYDLPARALTAEGLVNPELGAHFVAQVLEPPLRLFAERLRAAQDAGQVARDIDPRVAVELVCGPLTHRWLLRTLPLTHEYADAVVETALRGILQQ
ncbi:TetR/AcrR family transcriptional regulator [Streptomyces cuspidosporus]|uniref:TetR/AcrR family transcriptional regulator n=1 Tax=Streptomyces cuspidosporus TaxID=66882 RepID=A0ABP5SL62_9ACTN